MLSNGYRWSSLSGIEGPFGFLDCQLLEIGDGEPLTFVTTGLEIGDQSGILILQNYLTYIKAQKDISGTVVWMINPFADIKLYNGPSPSKQTIEEINKRISQWIKNTNPQSVISIQGEKFFNQPCITEENSTLKEIHNNNTTKTLSISIPNPCPEEITNKCIHIITRTETNTEENQEKPHIHIKNNNDIEEEKSNFSGIWKPENITTSDKTINESTVIGHILQPYTNITYKIRSRKKGKLIKTRWPMIVHKGDTLFTILRCAK